MMSVDYFEVGKPVKVMDFIGVITALEFTPDDGKLFVTVDSPKRIALHQTNLDRLDFFAAAWAWEPATGIDLLQDAVKWLATL